MEAIRTSLAMPFDEAVERVKSVFKDHGFGTLTEIDVQKTLKEKIGEEIEPYKILGVCNPKLASRAIAAEHEIGLFLPCTVLVHECGGKVNVSAQDPAQMMTFAKNDGLTEIAAEARERIMQAISEVAR
ncbi:MAG TPA: DUF302 domain-containing protein [Fimbriimonadaceae bacterium]|nr:DUF302 domain-containing protein [Fimbriimonadaceae bacterium]